MQGYLYQVNKKKNVDRIFFKLDYGSNQLIIKRDHNSKEIFHEIPLITLIDVRILEDASGKVWKIALQYESRAGVKQLVYYCGSAEERDLWVHNL